MQRFSKIRAAGVAAIFLAVGGGAYAAGNVTVEQKDLSFGQETLTVKQGAVIEFKNGDDTSHNIIISGDGVNLNSGLQQPGVAFSAPMLKKGKFEATCGIHPKMKMTIVVN